MTAEPRYVYPSPAMFGPVWCELPACSAEHVVIPKSDYEALVGAAAAFHELAADIPNRDALSPSDVAAFIRGRWNAPSFDGIDDRRPCTCGTPSEAPASDQEPQT